MTDALISKFLAVLSVVAGLVLNVEARYTADWNSIDSRPLPQWFDEAKVGIFIHWGVFSVPSFAGEWFWSYLNSRTPEYVNFMKRIRRSDSSYQEFAQEFTCDLFKPDDWAKLFKESGAKYVVLTSKHHEGYTLWPAKHSFNWNAKAIGPNRDLVGELGESVRKAGLKYGLYHSWFEWFHPLYVQDRQNHYKTREFVLNKVSHEIEELVNLYKPEVLWSDGDWEASDSYWNSTGFLAWLYNESPVKNTVVVNDRWGSGTPCKHGGYYTCHDRFNPGKVQTHKWENAMSLDRKYFGYRREAPIEDYLSIDELIVTLVQTISCGGNILINIGPTKYGLIAPIFQERLLQLGQWLSINGEAIYGSKPWSSQRDSATPTIWYTQKSSHVYGIVIQYPKNDALLFADIPFEKVHSVSLLGVNRSVSFQADSHHTKVQFPNLKPTDPVRIAYTFKFVFK